MQWLRKRPGFGVFAICLFEAIVVGRGILATGFQEKRAAITPTLEPESHQVFFKKDYPHDFQPATPGADKKFEYPYPIVQDSGDFDKDYVKDENSDGGQWKVQMEYDLLRSKIQKQRQDAKETAQAAQEKKSQYEKAKAQADEAARTAEAAAKEAAAATKAEEESEEHLRKLVGKTAAQQAQAQAKTAAEANASATSGDVAANKEAASVNGTSEEELGGEVGDSVQNVEKRVKGLKECQEELADAREKLKKTMEEKEKREKAKADAKLAQAQKQKEEAEAAAKANANATKAAEEASAKQKAARQAKDAAIEKEEDAKLSKARADADAAKAKVEELEKHLKEEEANYEKADSAYEKDLQDTQKLVTEIDATADRLRKFRKADAGGGVYSTEKSGSSRPLVSLALLAGLYGFVLHYTL